MTVNQRINDPPTKNSTGGQSADPQSDANGLRILIVDDNVDAAGSLGRLLALMTHDVCVAHDGPSALLEVARFAPQVVLLDLGMPGMDGLETAKKIRELPQGRGITFVAVTGWGQERDRQRTDAAGFAAHLTKPVNMQQLEMVLARIATTLA